MPEDRSYSALLGLFTETDKLSEDEQMLLSHMANAGEDPFLHLMERWRDNNANDDVRAAAQIVHDTLTE